MKNWQNNLLESFRKDNNFNYIWISEFLDYILYGQTDKEDKYLDKETAKELAEYSKENPLKTLETFKEYLTEEQLQILKKQIDDGKQS